MTVKILVCDDQDPNSIITAVMQAGIEKPDYFTTKELSENLDELFANANSVFGPEGSKKTSSEFDKYDLILLDFGLTTLKDFPHRLTAEHVAGYMRALTKADYVVSLNKLPNVDFDLKYLMGDFDTRADLALNTELLSLKGLWNGEPNKDEFCPWYWPCLQEAANRRKKQVDVVREYIDQPILTTLNFPEQVISELGSQALAFLSPHVFERKIEKRGVREATFWDQFLNSSRTLSEDDRSGLLGVEKAELANQCPSDDPDVLDVVARVVAGELDFWFRRDILGPQNLLIDAPHLQMKYRFRPNENGAPNLHEWSRVAREWHAPYGLDPEFFGSVKDAEFCLWFVWSDKPCFWLPMIESSDAFESLADLNAERQTEIVFCEDIRSFRPRLDTQRFETALGRGIDVRYVFGCKHYDYSPLSQMAR
jgi:hypothetical protein